MSDSGHAGEEIADDDCDLGAMTLQRKCVGGFFLEPMAPLLVSQAGVLGSQPPVPVIALTGDDPAGAFPR